MQCTVSQTTSGVLTPIVHILSLEMADTTEESITYAAYATELCVVVLCRLVLLHHDDSVTMKKHEC